MQITRHLSLVDLTVAIIVVVVLILPPRSVEAVPAHAGSPADLAALGHAEAASFAAPTSGEAAADYVRQLLTARQLDWAVDAGSALSAGQKGSPSQWRTMLATSLAHAARLDAVSALDWAQRALDTCHASGAACPSWEEIKLDLYARTLDAGVKSGIDPRKDPAGFRRAAGDTLMEIRLNGGQQTKPAAGSAAPATP